MRLIKWLVRDILKRSNYENYNLNPYLKLIEGAYTSQYLYDIYSLNHDILMEYVLKYHNIPFQDGFKELPDGIKIYDYENLDFIIPNNIWANKQVRLIKLHGSLDWWLFDRPNKGMCIEKSDNPYRTILDSDPLIKGQSNSPLTITGTRNKVEDYQASVYYSNFTAFYIGLCNINYLVCSGYGFGDHFINNRIIEWILHDFSRKLIVIHYDKDKLMRPQLDQIWNQIIFIEEKIENATWEMIHSKIIS